VKIINPMKRALTISVIVSVAVIMGLSAIAPVIPYVDASNGERLAEQACNALRNISDPPPRLEQFIAEHCGPTCPPNCGGDLQKESKTF